MRAVATHRIDGHFAWRAMLLLAVWPLTSGSAGAVTPEKTNWQPRRLAPGVMVTIEPSVESVETNSFKDVVELEGAAGLEWQPNFIGPSQQLKEQIKSVPYRREIWGLEFVARMVLRQDPLADRESFDVIGIDLRKVTVCQIDQRHQARYQQ